MCPSRFNVKGNCVRHERTHTGIRPFKCSRCPKRFAARADVTEHERTHTGIRPFKCSVCPKRFASRRNVAPHERIHAGDRPFWCSLCPKRFCQKSNLTVHSNTHTDEGSRKRPVPTGASARAEAEAKQTVGAEADGAKRTVDAVGRAADETVADAKQAASKKAAADATLAAEKRAAEDAAGEKAADAAERARVDWTEAAVKCRDGGALGLGGYTHDWREKDEPADRRWNWLCGVVPPGRRAVLLAHQRTDICVGETAGSDLPARVDAFRGQLALTGPAYFVASLKVKVSMYTSPLLVQVQHDVDRNGSHDATLAEQLDPNATHWAASTVLEPMAIHHGLIIVVAVGTPRALECKWLCGPGTALGDPYDDQVPMVFLRSVNQNHFDAVLIEWDCKNRARAAVRAWILDRAKGQGPVLGRKGGAHPIRVTLAKTKADGNCFWSAVADGAKWWSYDGPRLTAQQQLARGMELKASLRSHLVLTGRL